MPTQPLAVIPGTPLQLLVVLFHGFLYLFHIYTVTFLALLCATAHAAELLSSRGHLSPAKQSETVAWIQDKF